MNPILEICSSVIIATVVLIIFLRQAKKAQTGMNTNMEELRKSLQQSSTVLHEYHKFKTAFDSSYDAMVIANADGRVLFINGSVTRITGFSSAEAVGKKAGTLWGGLMSVKYYERLWRQVKTQKQPLVSRIVNKRKNGQQYLADVTITPILDDDGKKVEFFIAVERDLGTPPAGAIALLNAGQPLVAKYSASKKTKTDRSA